MNIVHHWSTDFPIEPGKPDKIYRKAKELYVVAMFAIGMQKAYDRQLWFVLSPDSEQSPDVRTYIEELSDADKAPKYSYQDVEVVAYIPKLNEGMIDFLKRTKLSSSKSYDEKTTILFHIEKAGQLPDRAKWDELARENISKANVYMLGKRSPTEPIYQIVQVYPTFKPVITNYHLIKTCLEQKTFTGVRNLTLGSRKVEKYSASEKHCPFEDLRIKCNAL